MLPMKTTGKDFLNASSTQNEAMRLEALYQYQILDTDPEKAFDDLTRLAAYICGTPVALVSLPDNRHGSSRRSVGMQRKHLAIAFCNQAILQPNVFIVTDALTDKRFATNPLVTSEPYIRFYAGVPCYTGRAYARNALRDHVPRQLEPHK